MPIRFACEKCGHPFAVDDRYAGKLGRCKHCGHTAPIPEGVAATPVSGLKLRPVEGENLAVADEDRPAPGLKIRPVPPEDIPTTRGLDPDGPEDDCERPADRGRPRPRRVKNEPPPYSVLDPDDRESTQARPFHLNPHYETRLARFVSRVLRGLRNWLFVISVGFLALGVIGFAFKVRSLMHVAATGVVAANAGMLVAGLFYLVTLPFKDSLAHGLGTLFLPPYAVYYWATHWPKMRKPVVNTLRSFTPIAAVGLGYLFYVQAPVIEREAIKVERVMERGGQTLERLAGPGDSTPVAPAGAPAPEPLPKTGGKTPF